MKIWEEIKKLEWNFRDWKILFNILSSSTNTVCISSTTIVDTAKNISGNCKHIGTFVQSKS